MEFLPEILRFINARILEEPEKPTATIVNGLCYLATFVFGINSIGLFLYSGQLNLNSFLEGSTEKKSESQGPGHQGLSNSSVESPTNNTQLSSRNEDESSNDKQ